MILTDKDQLGRLRNLSRWARETELRTWDHPGMPDLLAVVEMGRTLRWDHASVGMLVAGRDPR